MICSVDVERHARDFMEAAKKLQLYFIGLEREEQPTEADSLRKVMQIAMDCLFIHSPVPWTFLNLDQLFSLHLYVCLLTGDCFDGRRVEGQVGAYQ